MRLSAICLSAGLAVSATAALADFDRINSQDAFLRHVAGKTLTRPLINIRVTQDGRIEGRGSAWDVTGSWSWRDGYFCRDLYWGGDAMGYDCQEVQVGRGRVRFTSDQGTGQSAVFRLK